jgi:predicted NBD/HSP70 family sugar kinase
MIVADGPLCACGRVGCLEAVASGIAIERMARTVAAESPVMSKHRRRRKLTAEDVFGYAKEGDAAASAIVDSTLTHLADAISNLVNLLNPDRVILGGGLTRSGDFFMEPFLAKVRPRLLPDQNGRVSFALSESNEDSGLRGAATLVLQQLFNTVRGIDSGTDETQHPNGRSVRVPTVQDLIL